MFRVHHSSSLLIRFKNLPNVVIRTSQRNERHSGSTANFQRNNHHPKRQRQRQRHKKPSPNTIITPRRSSPPPSSSNNHPKIRLPPPTILFSNRQILTVNKPAGWHSIPIPSQNSDKKCLLHYLQSHHSSSTTVDVALRPMHRIDQPCTGLLLFAKTTNMAKQIKTAWNDKQVLKEYLCVIKRSNRQMTVVGRQYELQGFWRDKKKRRGGMMNGRHGGSSNSVIVTPYRQDQSDDKNNVVRPQKVGRLCQLKYKVLGTIPTHGNNHRPKNRHVLVKVTTVSGAKHQVRSMLAYLADCPIEGDLRYGGDMIRHPLPDQSVALHARRLVFPLLKQLGDGNEDEGFVAPIPSTWETFFGLTEELVCGMERQ